MTDLISRQDIKYHVQLEAMGNGQYEEVEVAYKDDIESLPSARPTGHWIHREDMDFLDENKVEHIHFMCSECGLIHDFLDGHTSQYNYCPQCGADLMEVEHE